MERTPWHKKKVAGYPLWIHGSIAVAIMMTIGVATIITILQSDAYSVAKAYVHNNPAVASLVGSPNVSRLAAGRMGFRYSDSYSSMHFPVEVSGPLGTASVHFNVVRRGAHGPWIVERAFFHSATYESELITRRE